MATRTEDPHPVDPTGPAGSAPRAVGTARRPRPSSKGEQTRARLLAAARSLLAGEEAGTFTTRNVAALSGVTHGMCHYHFQNRTDLIVAVIEDIRPEWIGPMEAAVAAPGTFAERAERVVELLTQPEGADLSRLHSAMHWFAVNDDRVRASLAAEYGRWRAAFVALFQVLADEHDQGFDPRPLGEAAAAGADGLAAIQALDPEVDAEQVVRALITGLAARARPSDR
ncbi:hypothetical protein GCM10009665_69030 [Kitasatospora nipponensis]|uniref:HTH tetR-type domain-containing protein n=1 Tax=Kitasatospora nipponensis TaxID=258049 RepID=A0ABP4HK23_9ACTN